MIPHHRDLLEVLSAPWEWRFISSLFPPELPPDSNAKAIKWYRKHSHTQDVLRQILVPLRGECFHGFGKELYRCAPGTVFLFDAMDEHDECYHPETTDVIHLWANFFEGRVLAVMVREFDSHGSEVVHRFLLDGMVEADLTLNRCWSDLREDTTLPASMKRIELTGVLLGFLFEVLRKAAYRHHVMTASEIQKAAILKVKNLIERTAGRSLTLDRLANITGYNKYHLHRLFRKSEGLTLHTYINACRIETCNAMLARGCKKKDIAETLGFSSPTAFSRWLRNKGSSGITDCGL